MLAGVALSVTVNLNEVFDKVSVGVPLMAPPFWSKLSPAGNEGVTDQFSGVVKPTVWMVVV
jgi:hypothetical protein